MLNIEGARPRQVKLDVRQILRYCNVAILSRLRLLSRLWLFWLYVQCQIIIQNQHREDQQQYHGEALTQAAIFVFSNGHSDESCWYQQDKTFPQLYFSKIDRYFYRLSASSPAIFSDFP
jgi:hypothetical protein